MKEKIKHLLIAILILVVIIFYCGSDYIWSSRVKSKAPASWVLVYEGKNRSLLPWTWFFPEPSGFWFITSPPEKLDSAIAKGQNLVLIEVVAFNRNDGKTERSEYSEVVSLDRKASYILKDEELKQLLAGRIEHISFDWTTYNGDNAGTAIVKYCGDHAVEESPELAPHFPTKEFVYIGSFFWNYTYIHKNEDGKLVGALADEHYEAYIASAREKVFALVQHPKTQQFALFDPSDRESGKQEFSDLKFQSASVDSAFAKAWLRATTPTAFEKDRKKGRLQEWIYVDVAAKDRQVDRFYVGTEIKTEPKSGFRFVPLLDVTEERAVFFLDPKHKQFAPVTTDLFWTPLEEMKYRDITVGGVGEAVMNFVTGTKSK